MYKERFKKKEENLDLIFGLRPIIEAISNGKEIDKLMIQTGLQGEIIRELRDLIQKNNIPFQYVPIEKLNRLTTKNHQGVVAFITAVAYHDLNNVLQQCYEKGEDPLFILLDRITDVRNFGAIARTAECMGVHGLIIPSRGSVRVGSDAVKTSAGALLKIPVCREDNLKDTIKYLRESGLRVAACTEKTKDILFKTDLNGPLCIIMGSEEDGISPEYLKMCDIKVSIPMYGTIGSLNVSVASGILLGEVIRQRNYNS